MYTNSYDAFLNVKNGFPVFSTALEANYVRKHEDTYAAFKLTDEDKADIHKLARDARIGVSRRHLPTPGRFCMCLALHHRFASTLIQSLGGQQGFQQLDVTKLAVRPCA